MNICIHVGNLTRDPETKVMTNGKPRCTFNVAINREYTNSQGVREADFITFTAYGKTAELAGKYLAKGRKVGVTSKVKTGSYENQEKKRVYTTEFVVEKLEFLSPASEQQEQATAPQESYHSEVPSSGYDGGFTQVVDDELPF